MASSTRTCLDCGTDISHLHCNAKRCNKCKAIKSKNFEEMIKYVPGFLDDKVEGTHYVTCAICGFRSRGLQTHLRYEHNLKNNEYEEKYNAPVFCTEEKERMSNAVKGENNPGYNHGGRLSRGHIKTSPSQKKKLMLVKRRLYKLFRNLIISTQSLSTG